MLGDGADAYRAELEEGLRTEYCYAPAHLSRQRAGAVAALAEQYLREGKTVSGASFAPDYLRLSQAERERAEREKKS